MTKKNLKLKGCRSVRSDHKYREQIARLNPKSSECIRAFYTLDVYHLRPWYERNSNYTVITYYSHLDLKGSIPSWVLNGMVADTPKIILSLKRYMEENEQLLSEPGQLHIPLDMLEYVGIEPDGSTFRVHGDDHHDHHHAITKRQKSMDFAFDDEELSDTNSVIRNKYTEELRFVPVGNAEECKLYKNLETPLSTPDMLAAESPHSSDLDDDGHQEMVSSATLSRQRSGVEDIDGMEFAEHAMNEMVGALQLDEEEKVNENDDDDDLKETENGNEENEGVDDDENGNDDEIKETENVEEPVESAVVVEAEPEIESNQNEAE